MTDPRHSMTLTRTVNAPALAVYAAWTVPDPMSRWLGKVEADVRPGGRYRFESDAGEGKTFVFTGEYLVLEPGRRVVQSFLAGEADTPTPYPNEFIEVRLREISETQTELTFIDGWNGEAIGEDGIEAAKAGWLVPVARPDGSVARGQFLMIEPTSLIFPDLPTEVLGYDGHPLTKATTRGIETMPKRQPKPRKQVPSQKQPEPTAELRAALTRRKKAELVDVLMELAEADRGFLRQLTARFEVATAPDALVAATNQAIADATDFDERDINSNFAYDYEAYSEVKRNLIRLIGSGQLPQAMSLALEVMKRGSYQVEMSDEGEMTEEIEDGLKVIIEALRKSDLPAAEVIAWCSAMLDSDRVGFIAREPLQSLRNQFQKR